MIRTDLKVEDLVCIRHFDRWNHDENGQRSRYVDRGHVEKITKTQVTAFGGRRFLVSSGKEVGASTSRWSVGPCIERDTPEIAAAVAHSAACDAAETACSRMATIFQKARGDEAIRLAAFIGTINPEQAA